MTDKKHSGWTNYETWNVNLWLSNDEGLYQALLKAVKDGQSIEEFVRDMAEASGGKFGDLCEVCLNRVNWQEIADLWKE